MSQDQRTGGGGGPSWGQGDFGVWLPGERPPADAPPAGPPQWEAPPRPRLRRSAELAAPSRRILSRIVDWVVVTVLFVLPVTLLAAALVLGDGSGSSSPGTGGLFVLGLLVLIGPALYEIVCIALWGRTAGKWLLSIKVVDERDGTVPGWYGATARWVPNLVSLVPLVGGLLSLILWVWSLVNLFTHPKRQTPFDLMAGTVVIRTR